MLGLGQRMLVGIDLVGMIAFWAIMLKNRSLRFILKRGLIVFKNFSYILIYVGFSCLE